MSPAKQSARHRIVVDGSNLATEGRTTPSLQQLDEAVRAYVEENPKAEVIVVADATFEHRVAANERARFKEAELAGEIVTPPAGAIGRGDAFILKIAARIDALVLSNDSFQEFHDEYPWLFDEGRLIGGKPVPGVGWVFTARLPVRGVKSSRAPKKLTVVLPPGVEPAIGTTITPPKGAAKAPTKVARGPAKAAKAAKLTPPKSTAGAVRTARGAPTAPRTAGGGTRGTKESARPAAKGTDKSLDKSLDKAADKAADKALDRGPTKRPAPKKAGADRAPVTRTKTAKKVVVATAEPAVALRRGRQPVNPESEFAHFVAEHRVRSHLNGEVVTFTSHGAIIAVTLANGARVECYAPTTSLGNPPPARARDALKRGDERTFRLTSVDRDRRIAELALV